jgi:hypothetical protein
MICKDVTAFSFRKTAIMGESREDELTLRLLLDFSPAPERTLRYAKAEDADKDQEEMSATIALWDISLKLPPASGTASLQAVPRG